MGGVARDSGAAETARHPIPATLYHALSGLLFSHAELWDQAGGPRPCSFAFTEGADSVGFGWIGNARVSVWVHGEQADPACVTIRDASGREAKAWSLPAGQQVEVRLSWDRETGAGGAEVEGIWAGMENVPALYAAEPVVAAPIVDASVAPEVIEQAPVAYAESAHDLVEQAPAEYGPVMLGVVEDAPVEYGPAAIEAVDDAPIDARASEPDPVVVAGPEYQPLPDVEAGALDDADPSQVAGDTISVEGEAQEPGAAPTRSNPFTRFWHSVTGLFSRRSRSVEPGEATAEEGSVEADAFASVTSNEAQATAEALAALAATHPPLELTGLIPPSPQAQAEQVDLAPAPLPPWRDDTPRIPSTPEPVELTERAAPYLVSHDPHEIHLPAPAVPAGTAPVSEAPAIADVPLVVEPVSMEVAPV
ncbi:MAG TPA: hypothetical protein VJY35_11375, partial [Candidatus Eisenbacteria bacterium]|nr:hypothetical protein [Candidatus Eisenbacteria bacterium]